jgi:DNA-binding GntR family transcriptional regulator
MREALNRLVAEGFVDIEDQRGFSVAAISLDHWRELVRTRCLVESCALSEAIAQRSEAWEDEIVVSLHRLARTPRFLSDTLRTPNPDWEIVHQRFHKALLAACGSSILLGFCQDLREQSDRYRHIASVAPEARLTYRQEHEAIAKAALDGDADLATKTLRAHYERTLIVVEKFFNEPA